MLEIKSIIESLSSPEHYLPKLSNELGVEIVVKRDDLLPFYFGGNKVRKNLFILYGYLLSNGIPDVLITNGGAESNHARVVSLIGHQIGATVELVLHGEKPSIKYAHGNSFIYNCTGASVTYVSPSDVSDTISEIKNQHQARGNNVFVVPGGAHSKQGVLAYDKSIEELKLEPDAIVLASGTGGTQAGMISGVSRLGLKSRVVGISVARDKSRGVDAISQLLPSGMDSLIEFHDEFRHGGYELYSSELLKFIRRIISLEGIPLDPTYTGKAMYGLYDLVQRGDIKKGSRIVFWHTGGLLNLQAANL